MEHAKLLRFASFWRPFNMRDQLAKHETPPVKIALSYTFVFTICTLIFREQLIQEII